MKVPLCVGDLNPHLKHGSLSPTESKSQTKFPKLLNVGVVSEIVFQIEKLMLLFFLYQNLNVSTQADRQKHRQIIEHRQQKRSSYATHS